MSKFLRVCVLFAALVAAGLPARAVVTTVAPSVALQNRHLATPIHGVDLLKLAPKPAKIKLPKITPPCSPCPPPQSAQVQSPPDKVPPGNDGAECHYCLVTNGAKWVDYGDSEKWYVDTQKDTADELIDQLHVHGVVLRVPHGSSDCYSDDGDYVYIKNNDNFGQSSNVISSDGQSYSGQNNRWNQTIGAQFWDGNGYWELLGGEIDICKQF